MLSVIVYGRNDAHGYNLPKRAAISLNCLAQVLGDDDEILFADYNTPNDLPTFPEAVRDTLTPRARGLLRVLRIRPAHHAPQATRTHLALSEPVARNAAIRRARPGNRWLLSTNTDVVLVPPPGTPGLSAVLPSLAEGSWHLPRFELPEAVWEEFDRLDPAGILSGLAALGDRLGLDEIVSGSEAAVFDGHGDFQLMARHQVEAVHGFDERMRYGWVLDSNLARRLALRWSPAQALPGGFRLYHCDHTRVVGAIHGWDRVENDYRRFFAGVDRPEPPGQDENWGLAGVELEEIRLATGSGIFVRALSRVLPAPGPPLPPVSYSPDHPAGPAYPAEHVLPYLCNLILTHPRTSRLAWFGGRAVMLRLFVRAWTELGFVRPILVPDSCPLETGDLPGLERVPEAEALAGAGLFVFEFGAASQDRPGPPDPGTSGRWSDADLGRLVPVRRGLERLAAAERALVAAGAASRLVIAINAVNTLFEPLVAGTVASGRIPYSTRLRHGPIIAAPPPAEARSFHPKALAPWLGRRLGRRQPVPITEAVRLVSDLETVLEEPVGPARLAVMTRNATALLALLEHPWLTGTTPAGRLEALRIRITATRGSVRLAARLSVPVVAVPPPPAPCRLATVEDWEDDDWLAIARHFCGPFAANRFHQSGALWARVHIVRELERAAIDDRKVLVVAGASESPVPEPLAEVLSERGWQVTLTGTAGAAPAGLFRDPAHFTVRAEAELPAAARWSVVVLAPGPTWDVSALVAARTRLVPGGILAVAVPVRLDGEPHPPSIPAAALAVTVATLDHAWSEDMPPCPHYVAVSADGVTVTGVWLARG
jgi:hypothetical protein